MYRKLLLGSTMLAGLISAAPALAQNVSGAPTQPSANVISEVVVTGSRIPRPNLQQPTPVETLGQVVIANSGTANLGDILTQLPAIGFSGTIRANSNNFGNGYGVSSINLRNLGLSRTLVLVDGYRHVAGDIGTNAVDVNSVPVALVDRVEVITGGASAIYGSDAVTGVVNIVLKKKFTGIEAEAQAGADDGGYGANYSASATIGQNFLNDKLNINVTGFWTKQAGVDARNLHNAHNYGSVINPADATCAPDFSVCSNPKVNDGIPDRLLVQNVGSKFVTLNGVLLNANTFQPQYSFNAAGQLIAPPTQTGYNSFAFGQLPRNCQDCYFGEDFEQLASPFESKGAEFRANYEFTPHLRAFLDAKYVETDTVNTIQPSFSFGDFQLQPDNAFIQPDLRGALVGTAPSDYPFIGKFLNPGRVAASYRRTYRIVAGLQGDFDATFSNVKWDAAINYGRTNDHFRNSSLKITDNFAAAFDSVIDPATGKPACRINVPSAPQNGIGAAAAAGCIPFNPFGQLNNAAAYAYSFGSFDTTDSLSQADATINASFDSGRFFKLPGGPISVAVGGEYRMERTFEVNDPRLVAGSTENLSSNSSGGYNVYEGYVEGNFPILKHNGFLRDELTLDVAYRGAQYSFKQVGYADSYKFGGVYGPVDWLKLRGTYARAIRAPNITEAFLPPSPSFFNVADPCSQENIGSNVNYPKNCATAGVPVGFQANTNASIQGVTSGNPNLNPEKSFSYTGGFVLTPPMIPRLSITVDYYAIKIKNAITNVAAQDIINNCYSTSAGLDPTYCSLFTRSAANGNINFVSTTFVNASKLYTDGIDVQVAYSLPVADYTSRWNYTRFLTGRLSFDLTANYLFHLHDFPFQTNPNQVQILEGTANNPHMKALLATTYTQGPLQFVYSVRYLGRGALFNRNPDASDHSEATDVPYATARFYHNLAVHYQLHGKYLDGAEVYGGVNNIFGDLPPYQTIGQAGTSGANADTGYDLGRFIFAGVKFKH